MDSSSLLPKQRQLRVLRRGAEVGHADADEAEPAARRCLALEDALGDFVDPGSIAYRRRGG